VSTVLHGTATTLRPATTDDTAVFATILAEPEVARWWPRYDTTRITEDLIKSAATNCFAVEHEGEVTGAILYVEEPSLDYRHATIDVFLHPGWHGKGLGTDAVRTMARHLVHDRGHHRLAIDPAADNEPAIRTYERVGFRRVGVLREYERGADGEWHDCLLMDLLKRELQ
jgi:aminoglycoside 6'-N-acetyltransferase